MGQDLELCIGLGDIALDVELRGQVKHERLADCDLARGPTARTSFHVLIRTYRANGLHDMTNFLLMSLYLRLM